MAAFKGGGAGQQINVSKLLFCPHRRLYLYFIIKIKNKQHKIRDILAKMHKPLGAWELPAQPLFYFWLHVSSQCQGRQANDNGTSFRKPLFFVFDLLGHLFAFGSSIIFGFGERGVEEICACKWVTPPQFPVEPKGLD